MSEKYNPQAHQSLDGAEKKAQERGVKKLQKSRQMVRACVQMAIREEWALGPKEGPTGPTSTMAHTNTAHS